MRKTIGRGVLFWFLTTVISPADDAGLTRIELTCIDPTATGYGTFQSHNQKVVENANGIFMTHLRSRNEAYTAQQWRLSRSKDGGKTFTTIFEATDPTNPPVLETDSRANLYLARPDLVEGSAWLYRFAPDDDYAVPRRAKIPGAAAGKYAMFLDQMRQEIYFFSHNNSFHVLSLEGDDELTLARHAEVCGAIDVAIGMTSDHDRLGPAGY